jgi:hypothetical protein
MLLELWTFHANPGRAREEEEEEEQQHVGPTATLTQGGITHTPPIFTLYRHVCNFPNCVNLILFHVSHTHSHTVPHPIPLLPHTGLVRRKKRRSSNMWAQQPPLLKGASPTPAASSKRPGARGPRVQPPVEGAAVSVDGRGLWGHGLQCQVGFAVHFVCQY